MRTDDCGKRAVEVALLTPYLTDSLGDMLAGSESFKDALFQFAVAGYDPNNLHGVDRLTTVRNTVLLRKPCDAFDNILPDLAIAGCTEEAESAVQRLIPSGVLFARYSMFYGGPSEYTRKQPEESGYSFDIPKQPKVVLAFLNCDDFLDGIAERNEEQIRAGVSGLNEKLSQPVIVTPHLARALQIRRRIR